MNSGNAHQSALSNMFRINECQNKKGIAINSTASKQVFMKKLKPFNQADEIK